MRLKHKVGIAVLGGVIWIGAVAAQAADQPASSLASAQSVVPNHRAGSQMNAATTLLREGQSSLADDSTTVPPPTSSALPPVSTTTSPARTASPPVASAAVKSAPAPPAYDAGGSMSSSSSASQVYAQTTQAGWGCQAALQYLAQHANPQFTLVCPGYAMGHQAMTCFYQSGACPDSAEIVIADPCPAAYQNEAWNSWHMPSGPFDPYGWCSDWNNQNGSTDPLPPLTAAGPQPNGASLSG